MPYAHSVHFASFLATRTPALERDYIVSTVSYSQGFLVRAVPPIAGVMLIIVFSKLGLWQLDRANQKNDMQKAFANPASYIEVSDTLSPSLYTAIEATGRYQPDTQILIDNVIVDGRLGYYVISAHDRVSPAQAPGRDDDSASESGSSAPASRGMHRSRRSSRCETRNRLAAIGCPPVRLA